MEFLKLGNKFQSTLKDHLQGLERKKYLKNFLVFFFLIVAVSLGLALICAEYGFQNQFYYRDKYDLSYKSYIAASSYATYKISLWACFPFYAYLAYCALRRVVDIRRKNFTTKGNALLFALLAAFCVSYETIPARYFLLVVFVLGLIPQRKTE